jgi:hypothetical protein
MPGLLACILVPAGVAGQAAKAPRATISLFEQPGGFVQPASKRLYTNYFNSLRTRFIAVNVTLEYARAADVAAPAVSCAMTRPDGRVIEGIWKIGMSAVSGSNSSTGTNIMFGAGKEGWPTGVYKVICSAGSPLGETFFQMSPGPSLLTDLEMRLTAVRFFLTGAKLVPPEKREYQDRFLKSAATMVGIELSFAHPAPGKSGAIPVDCYYLNGSGNVFSTLGMTYEFEATSTKGSVAIGSGWEQPGNWPTGDYLAVCQLHGRPLVVERFTIW